MITMCDNSDQLTHGHSQVTFPLPLEAEQDPVLGSRL